MRLGALGLATLLACGCSSVGSSAVRTGGASMPAYSGPVGVYAATVPTQGTELGVVEVHAVNSEGVLETLVPLFVKRVAQLGGNAAIIDGVRAHFEIVAHPYTETFTYPCGWGAMCIGTRVYAVNDEVMVVTVRGRAWSTPGSVR
ncbi:MAG TPA: hypothetical protein VIF15_06310 [Polyangiaceae bacterium]